MDNLPLSPVAFKALLKNDLAALLKLTLDDCRPILPYLVRMCFKNNHICDLVQNQTELMKFLLENEHVNYVAPMLSLDFSLLSQEIISEAKSRSLNFESTKNISTLDFKTAIHLQFEKGDYNSKIKILVNEVYSVFEKFQKKKSASYFIPSELFDPKIYFNEICDLLCIFIIECPSVVKLLDIVKLLLHVRSGSRIICVLVANMPHRFKEVCHFLIQLDEKQQDNKESGKVRTDTLRILCQLNPYQALWVRNKCVEFRRLAALTIYITLDYERRSNKHNRYKSDIIKFILSVLLGHDQKVRTWFSSYIYNSQKESDLLSDGFKLLQKRLLKELNSIVRKCVSDNKIKPCKILKASSLVRVYCALKGMAKYQLQDKEMSQIVKILIARPPRTLSGTVFMSLGLSVFITVPSLLRDKTHLDSVIQWIKWFLQEEAYIDRSSSSFEEMLLLMAIHFHNNQSLAVCELAYSKLGMKISVRNSTLLPIKKIFTEEIFTEEAVTLHAAKVPVTMNLNANISGFLPLHCIYHLLKSQAFIKHKVSIKDWIYRQIRNSVAPLHPILPPIVELYVKSLLIPLGAAAKSFVDEPFSEQDISQAFSEFMCGHSSAQKDVAVTDSSRPSPSLTSLLLLTYYVLLYEDTRVSNISKISSQERKVVTYTDSFLSGLPIRYLLLKAQADQSSYTGLFPSLLRLLVKNLPHLSLIPDWIEGDINHENSLRINQSMELNKDSIIKAFSEVKTCPSSLRKLLEELSQVPAINLWEHSEVLVEQIKNILDNGVLRSIQDMYKNVWLLLNKYLPEKVWVMTVNALHVNGALPLKEEDIMFDPLLVLRCDTRVFRCAPVLDILLRVLEGSLAASKNYFSKNVKVCSAVRRGEEKAGSLRAEYESQLGPLIALQESAAIQILLESCLETEEDKSKKYLQWALREIRGIICSYLHSLFINDPLLLKLVHFQGYSHDLLPVTVQGIPSMHICLDFIPELLNQPHLDKQVFAIDLVSHIALKYRIPKSYNAAYICIDLVKTFPAVLSSEERVHIFSTILPCLVRLAKACPTQVDDILKFLMTLGSMCASDISITSVTSSEVDWSIDNLTSKKKLYDEVDKAISEIFSEALLVKHVY